MRGGDRLDAGRRALRRRPAAADRGAAGHRQDGVARRDGAAGGGVEGGAGERRRVGGRLPLGAVRQLFEPALRRASGSERERWSRGAGEIAGRLLAEAAAGVRARSGTSADAAAVRSSVYWLAVALAEDEPLAVLIDDLQWVDRESLRWVLFAARRLRGTGIALIVSTRGREPGGDESCWTCCAGCPTRRSLRLAPSAPGATAELVATWSRSGRAVASFAATCHRLSGGNPFLLTQLLREAGRVGVGPDPDGAARLGTLVPEGIARAVLRRLRASGEAAVPLARAVAVLGAGATLGRAAELAELPSEAAAAEADVLIRADVLRDEERLEIAAPARARGCARRSDVRRAGGAPRARRAPARRGRCLPGDRRRAPARRAPLSRPVGGRPAGRRGRARPRRGSAGGGGAAAAAGARRATAGGAPSGDPCGTGIGALHGRRGAGIDHITSRGS